MSFLPSPWPAQLLRSYHLLWEVMVLGLRVTAPSLPHEYIDIHMYIYMYKYVYVCVRIHIFAYINFGREWIPALNLQVQIRNKHEHGPPINDKTPCPKPNPWAPLQKKKEKKIKDYFFLRGKIKMLLSHLLILLHPYFYSLFNWPFASLHR